MAEQTMSNQEMKRKNKNPLKVEAQLWANDLITLALDLQMKNQTFCFFGYLTFSSQNSLVQYLMQTSALVLNYFQVPHPLVLSFSSRRSCQPVFEKAVELAKKSLLKNVKKKAGSPTTNQNDVTPRVYLYLIISSVSQEWGCFENNV